MQQDTTPAKQRSGTESNTIGANKCADAEIEGGDVSDIPEVLFDERKHRAKTARLLALTLAGILAGTLLVHYVTYIILAHHDRQDVLTGLSEIFNVWFPALIGIVSGAATYFFTKER